MNSCEKSLDVVIPVTKLAGRLNNLFRILEESNRENIRIILIHDVQDENTGPEIKEYLDFSNLSNVTVIEGNFGSPGKARNEGLKYANAEWLSFWDADDLSVPAKYISEISKRKRPGINFIVGGYNVHSLKTKSKIRTIKPHSLATVGLNPGIWRWIFKRERIARISFVGESMGEDQLFLAKCNPERTEIHFSEEIFYNYFVEVPGQLTSNKLKIDELLIVNRKLKDLIKNKNNVSILFLLIMYLRQIMTLRKNRTVGNIFLIQGIFFTFVNLGRIFRQKGAKLQTFSLNCEEVICD